MADPKDSLPLLIEFIVRGDVGQVASAAATVLAHVARLDRVDDQIEALDGLRTDLVNQCDALGLTGGAQDRHVAVEDAIEQAIDALRKGGG